MTNDFYITKKETIETVERDNSYAFDVARELYLPVLMPIFPRPEIGYYYDNERNYFYTHILDRDTATLDLKMKDPVLANILTVEFEKAGFKIEDFYNIDEQLIAMIDHAIEYMNSYNYNINKDKIFMIGFSASGGFADRFSTLHPEKIKAVAAGAALDDMILPLSNYMGENLIFPIGTYDYKEITGRDFDLNMNNNVARLVFMGEMDPINVLNYSDTYGKKEIDIITKLWGWDILPRAKSLTKLYGKVGGKGIFILDKGEGHSTSEDMRRYFIEFFRANLNSDKPVYPIPENPDQLMYTLFE